ncbi:hypothetical protein TNCV_4993471 [Trichonephila clavipes]|nr:hypothetical protein TNCV_4993471 [Trichonephila clavipes]
MGLRAALQPINPMINRNQSRTSKRLFPRAQMFSIGEISKDHVIQRLNKKGNSRKWHAVEPTRKHPQHLVFLVGCSRRDPPDRTPSLKSSLCKTAGIFFAWKFFFHTQHQYHEQAENPLSTNVVMQLMPSSDPVQMA